MLKYVNRGGVFLIIRVGGSDFFRTFAVWIKKNPIEPAKSVKIIAGFFIFTPL